MDEYAFWRGVNPSTIRDKIRQNILPEAVRKKENKKWFIHQENADKILDSITTATTLERTGGLASKNGRGPVEPVDDGDKSETVTIQVEGKAMVVPRARLNVLASVEDENEKFWRIKREKEEVALSLQKVKLGEQRGTLIKADKVKKTVMKLFGDAKEQILNIPDQLGPELLACTDLVDLQTRMQEAINKALSGITDKYGDTENE